MFISKFQLLVFPKNPYDSVASDHLADILMNMEFIGKEEVKVEVKVAKDKKKEGDYKDANHSVLRFTIGNKFLSHIAFLGCSPDIELEPQKDKPYSYIEISPVSDSVHFISGMNIKPTRCPQCKKDLTDLLKRLAEKSAPLFEIQGEAQGKTQGKTECQHCHTPIDLFKLNFRKSACFARTYITVGNIYESEAVPDDHFLMTLHKKTGFEWKYAYVRFP